MDNTRTEMEEMIRDMEMQRMHHEHIMQSFAAQAARGATPDRGATAIDILKALIAARGVSVEMAGLDEAIVDQAFRYADLVVDRVEKHNAEKQAKSQAAQAAAYASGMRNAAQGVDQRLRGAMKYNPMNGGSIP